MLLLVATIYLLLTTEFIQTLTIHIHHLPKDVQDFIHQKRFVEDGFHSFHIVHPQHEDGGDLRPFHTNILNTFTKRELKLHLPIEEDSIIMKLTPNISVLHPNSVVSFSNGSKEEPVDIKDLKSCYLVGYIISHGGLATFSHCGQTLEGAMMINGTEMLVKGLPQHLIHRHRRSVADQPLLVARRQMKYSSKYIRTDINSLGHAEIHKKRRKRSLSGLQKMTIEIAVYVDSALTNSLEKEHDLKSLQQKIDFVIVKYNAVQYEYWQEKLTDLHIIIQVKKIVFFTQDPMEHFKENNLDSVLDSFCSWQRLNIPRFDHVMLLSIKRSLIPGGRAYKPGICRASLHCALNNQAKWGFWYLEAHELGHNLGMSHSVDTTNCRQRPDSDGVMGSKRTGWSVCSRDALLELIVNNKAECLHQENVNLPDVGFNASSRLLNGIGLLPGLYLTLDDTCELNYGPGFRYRAYPRRILNIACMLYSCTYVVHDDRYGEMKVNRHAIAGAYCGKNKVCLLTLHCVDVRTLNLKVPITITKGGWGSWSAWSKCISVCGPGIKYRERLCTNPKPMNSPNCDGQQYSSVACTGKPCSVIRPIHNIIQKAINDICKHLVKIGILNKKHYGEGILFGSDQLTVCEVICHSNPRLKTDRFQRYGLLPDGTPCELPEFKFDPMRWKKKAICINGACEPVGCDGVLYGKQFDVCGVCGGNGDSCMVVNEVVYLNEQSYTDVSVMIPKHAVNIKFTLSKSAKNNFLLSLISKDNQAVLNEDMPATKTNFTPIHFVNSYWDYDTFSFLMSSGPISEAAIVKVDFINSDHNARLIYNYSMPLQRDRCKISCSAGGGELHACSCLCRNSKGGPQCSSCNTVCLNGGYVDQGTCKCICPSPHMVQPNCACDSQYGGKDCSGCNYIFCGSCGSYDWESCHCVCEEGITGQNCERIIDSSKPVNCTPDPISIESSVVRQEEEDYPAVNWGTGTVWNQP